MKKRVADIVVETLLELGISETFCVVGGGTMHLNNAFEINKDMHVTFCHHEQSCAFAAEGYAKYSGKIACVSVTAGPGSVNALNGVYGAWVDSTPMFVISGYPRYETATPITGLNLRCRGVQEFDIVNTVKTMTKYSKLVIDPKEIKAEIQKAYNIAMTGRRGPVWLAIPLDVQAALLEDSDLITYSENDVIQPTGNTETIKQIISKLKSAKRPCILTGTGIRYGNAYSEFLDFLKIVQVPVIGSSLFPDALPMNYPLYYGNAGSSGPRLGNYIIQNSDLILVLANSLSTKQTGFNVDLFAPDAEFIMIDVEKDEPKKPGLHIDMPVEMDIKDFFTQYIKQDNNLIKADSRWIQYCDNLKDLLKNVDLPEFNPNEKVSSKQFGRKFVDMMPENGIIALGNSSCIGGVLTYGVRNHEQRVIVNYNAGSMGDDLPEAIGIAKATDNPVYCITGDGSIMMNLQELQTIKYSNLPIKVVVFNNNGYGAIRNTCKNFFNNVYTGCDFDSGISFPSFEKVAAAFDFKYIHCTKGSEVEKSLKEFFNLEGQVLLEVEQKELDPYFPRIVSTMGPNGKFTTPSLIDMSPALPDDLLNKIDNCKYW